VVRANRGKKEETPEKVEIEDIKIEQSILLFIFWSNNRNPTVNHLFIIIISFARVIF
jgi:hypothetical protein